MRKGLETELKVGLFVTTGLALIALAIIILGGNESIFTRSNTYATHFASVEGLVPGAKIVIGGIQVGTVDQISFDTQRRDILVTLRVAKKYEEWLRKGTQAEINTQGVLGDKFISLTMGAPDSPILPPLTEIPISPTRDLSQFLNKGDQLMLHLTDIASSLNRVLKTFESANRSDSIFSGMADTAKNLSSATHKLNQELDQLKIKQTIGHLNSILEKVNNGTGTLGQLVNDPSLYYETKSLVGGANRNRIIRNLVRKSVQDGDANTDEKK